MKFRYLLINCLVLTAVGISYAQSMASAAGPQEEIEYFAVFMGGKKVGYAIQSRVEADAKVTTSEEVSITISRANIPVTIKMTETSIETIDGKPIGFEVIQDLGIMTMKMAGTIDEQRMVNVTTTSMGKEQKSTMQWPNGAVMAEGLLQLSKRQGLKQGTTYTARIFSPGILQALDAQISVGSQQNVDLLGRVVTLTEVITAYSMPGAGQVVSTSYVDEDFKVQKSITPIIGIQLELVACAKAFALGENDVFEVVDKLFLSSPEPLGDVQSAKSVSYILSMTEDASGFDPSTTLRAGKLTTSDLIIPSNENQKVRRLGNGKIMVTVEPAAAPTGATFPYKGRDEKILEATKPNRYLQSDHEKIIELARRAVGGTKDTAEAVKRIESFAAEYIENKNLSIGYASAVEVADSKQGDCSEHAVFTAALCRAVGIPAQVVTGIAYVKEFGDVKDTLGGHAWVQAYVGQNNGKWIGLDAAFKGTGRGGYGPGHIALAVGNGNPEDLLNLVTTLGRFKIEKVIVNN
jgi:hypothetical protein